MKFGQIILGLALILWLASKIVVAIFQKNLRSAKLQIQAKYSQAATVLKEKKRPFKLFMAKMNRYKEEQEKVTGQARMEFTPQGQPIFRNISHANLSLFQRIHAFSYRHPLMKYISMGIAYPIIYFIARQSFTEDKTPTDSLAEAVTAAAIPMVLATCENLHRYQQKTKKYNEYGLELTETASQLDHNSSRSKVKKNTTRRRGIAVG